MALKLVLLFSIFLIGIGFANPDSPIMGYPGESKPQRAFRYVYFRHIKTHDALPLLKGICSQCEWVVSHSRQSVGVNVSNRNWTKIRAALQQIDKPMPQVSLNIEILEISNIQSKRYQQLFSNLTEPILLNQELESLIQLMISSGNAKIISSPKLVGASGTKIQLMVGEKLPYINTIETNGTRSTQLSYVDSGIELEITPFVHYKNKIDMSIKLNYNTISGYRTESGVDLPILATRLSELNLQIPNKQTMVFAGLLDESMHASIEKIPLLGDLPFLGVFFRRKVSHMKSTDLIFKITPVKQ
ncbi:MAG: type II and III secretion system protein [Candidatus Margulisiibacteriota bacterium]